MSEFGFYFDNEGDTSHSFIIDSNPDQINPYTQQEEEKKKQSANQDQEVINDDPQSASGQLLLPEHVRIAQDKKRKQTEAEERDGSEDGDHQEKENLDGEQDGASQDGKQSEIKDGTGDYLQLDVRSRGEASRYYQADEDEQIRNAKECANCGERGHDKRDCEHLLCVSCGAFDDHATRDCPMKVSCFRCGQSGHIANKCHKPPAPGERLGRHCSRCGSRGHVEMTCPSLWRIYAYNTDDEYARGRAIAAAEMERQRRAEGGDFSPPRKRRRRSGDSGASDMDLSEGEISSEALLTPRSDWDPAELWCYNCAARGEHWGDDCPHPRATHKRGTLDPSAFSDFVSTSGPFGRRIPSRYRSDTRRDDRDQFEFGNHHQHFDFQVGDSASMHVSGIRPGPGFQDEYDHIDDMAAIDSLFDPSNRPHTKKSKEREARERSRSEKDRRREKRRRTPSPETFSDRSKGKGKGKSRDSWKDLDDYDSDDGFAKFDKGNEQKKKKPKPSHNEFPENPPENSSLAKDIRLKMIKKLDRLRTKSGNSSTGVQSLQQKIDRYEDELTGRGVVVGKGLSKTDKSELKKIKNMNGESGESKRGRDSLEEDSRFQNLDDYLDSSPQINRSHSRSSSSNSNKHRNNNHSSSSKADRYEQMKLEKEERLRLQNRGGPSDHRNGAPRQRYGEPSFGKFSRDDVGHDEDGDRYGYEGSSRKDGGGRSSSGSRGNKNRKHSHKSNGHHSGGNGGNRPRYQGSY